MANENGFKASVQTSEGTKIISNVIKVKVCLKNGAAEIYDSHIDLMGTIENNLVEIYHRLDGKDVKAVFMIGNGVIVVSNKGLDSKEEEKGTFVAVLGDKSREITESVTAASIASEIERSKASITNETALYNAMIGQPVAVSINSKIYLLQQELSFLERMSFIVEDMRKDKRS